MVRTESNAVKLPAQPVSASLARNLVEDTARRLDCLSDADIDDLCVAVGEAFANVILHGGLARTESVCIRIDRLPDRVSVHFDYISDAFDPNPKPPSPEELATGGYGLYIMHSLTDNVDFDFSDGRAHVCLQKLCPPYRGGSASYGHTDA